MYHRGDGGCCIFGGQVVVLNEWIWFWLAGSLLGVAGMLSLVFAWASRRNRFDVIDVFWGPSVLLATLFGVVVAYRAYEYPLSGWQFAVAGVVTVWALRLAWHIARRFRVSSSQDKRYTAMVESYGKHSFKRHVFLRIYLVQAVLAVMVASTAVAAIWSADMEPSWPIVVGLVVWAIGFGIEVLADRQLKQFRSNPKNKGRILSSGLWRHSRHPNYFGEALLWWGLAVISLPTMTLAPLGVVGALTITILVRFVSGVPPAERSLRGRNGWKSYTQTTSVFVPLPQKR